MRLHILRAGVQTTVQDLGRPGWRSQGVSAGGALDVDAVRVLNTLVGNAENAAVLEVPFGGLRVGFEDARLVAWSGAAGEVRVNSEGRVPAGRAVVVQEDDVLTMTPPAVGVRAWLAISGGVDVPEVLGSRSTDLRAGWGGWEGRALRDEDVLPLGVESEDARRLHTKLPGTGVAAWGASVGMLTVPEQEPTLRVVRGREWAQFSAAAQRAFFHEAFAVSGDSDRMGARLTGAALEYRGKELISEAVVPGTIQVPAGGQPIVLLSDCQTVGGYPKMAHVITADLARAAQLRPGGSVRFRETTVEEALRLRRVQVAEMERFRIGYRLRIS